MFDLPRAPIYKAVSFTRILPPRLFAIVRLGFFIGGALAGLVSILSRGASIEFSFSNIIPSLIDFWRQGGGTLAEPGQIDIALGASLGVILGF